MEAGSFFAFSRVDRQYNIYPGDINSGDWDANSASRAERTSPVLEMPRPEVNSITVDGNTITIDAENYCAIYWYADGIRIFEGDLIDLTEHQLYIYNYVRAAVVSYDYGVMYVQPFGVQVAGQEVVPNKITRIVEQLADIVFPTGTTQTEILRALPTWTRIDTADGPRNAVVVWDFSDIVYDPDYNETDRTLVLYGTARLLPWITNPDNVALDVIVNVTVLGVDPCCLCCEDTDMCLTGCGTPEQFIWSINEPRDARVSQTGTGGHVLVLDNIGITADDILALLAADEICLDIIYTEAGNNSNRRIIAWSDLSGGTDEVADITFANRARLDAGQIAWVPHRIVAGDASACITMPIDLLYDAATGRIATTIYVILTVDNIDEAADAGGNRGANEFIRFDHIKLSLVTSCVWDDFSNLVEHIEASNPDNDSSVLRLDIKDLGIVPTADALLVFNFVENPTRADGAAVSTNRLFNVWTDLSGTGEIAFASYENYDAGRIVRTGQLTGERDMLSVVIPAELLYDAATGTFATAIYVFCTLASTDNHYETGSHRTDLIRVIETTVLMVTNLDLCNCK
jgi:hypothetical protein